jgi:hypothetical protein
MPIAFYYLTGTSNRLPQLGRDISAPGKHWSGRHQDVNAVVILISTDAEGEDRKTAIAEARECRLHRDPRTYSTSTDVMQPKATSHPSACK